MAESRCKNCGEECAGEVDGVVAHPAPAFAQGTETAIKEHAENTCGHGNAECASGKQSSFLADETYQSGSDDSAQSPGKRYSTVGAGGYAFKGGDQSCLPAEPLSAFAGDGVGCGFRKSGGHRQKHHRGSKNAINDRANRCDPDVGQNLRGSSAIPTLGCPQPLLAREAEPGRRPGQREDRQQCPKGSRTGSGEKRKANSRTRHRSRPRDPPYKVSQGGKHQRNGQNNAQTRRGVRPPSSPDQY